MTPSDKTAISRTRLKKVVTFLPAVLVTIWLIFDDVIDAVLSPVFGRLSQWSIAIKAERWARSLRPYPALALLLVPAIVIEPAKLLALYLIGEEHYISGVIIMIAAFGAGIVFLERVFDLNRDKLLSIPWFAKLYTALTGMKQALYAWLRETSFGLGFSRRFGRRRSSRLAGQATQRAK